MNKTTLDFSITLERINFLLQSEELKNLEELIPMHNHLEIRADLARAKEKIKKWQDILPIIKPSNTSEIKDC